MPDNVIRDMLHERLHKKGWVTSMWIKEVSPNRTEMMMNLTEEGKRKLLNLYALFDELGLIGPHRPGELQVLLEAAAMCKRFEGKKSGEA
jgi:hypothetical protein